MKQQEAERIRTVYLERLQKKVYNPLDRGEHYLVASRNRCLVDVLHAFIKPPRTLRDLQILDIGCGNGNVLHQLMLLGAKPENLCGVDLLEEHIRQAQAISPHIRYIVSNAESLPFEDESWDLALMFMIMSSILDTEVQRQVAAEAMRVLKPNGAILWYDFWTNPINPNTVGMTRARIHALFPGHRCMLRRTTLAPPLARRLARISWPLCWLLESIPFLCTHYMGLIYKEQERA
ncbi:MAG: class I SAM-dependent methyltransferase [Fimbriimonadales bacterium]|nr:class I SAM-dependent methyltransferase [Fimbriimonadales bacterium]